MNVASDLDVFYSLLAVLERSPLQGRTLAELSGSQLPKRGVYFFREAEEVGSTAELQRVVRVGTHAVSANSKSTLWQRLRAHLGTRSGGGNHRGSIFRLHVGAALLARERLAVPSWGVGSTPSPALRADAAAGALESDWEGRVSAHIRGMTVLWVDVPDEPGVGSARAAIERNAIALLSNRCAPFHKPSSGWLGRHSPREEIAQSGLWNLNHVSDAYEPEFLLLLAAAVERTVKP